MRRLLHTWSEGLDVALASAVLAVVRAAGGRSATLPAMTSRILLTPIYRSPEYQRLARVVVLAWEPDDGAVISTQDEWLRGVRWMEKVFPDALHYIHMTAGRNAPCDQEGREAEAWKAVAPHLHGWLLQDAAFGGRDVEPGREPLEQFRRNLRQAVRRLHDGGDGWPTSSATDGRPLDVVAFEYASYWSYWKDRPESEARRWGEAALGVNGIAGFGDGGPAGGDAERR